MSSGRRELMMLTRRGEGRVIEGCAQAMLTPLIFIFPKSVVAMITKYNPGCPDKFEFEINNR